MSNIEGDREHIINDFFPHDLVPTRVFWTKLYLIRFEMNPIVRTWFQLMIHERNYGNQLKTTETIARPLSQNTRPRVNILGKYNF